MTDSPRANVKTGTKDHNPGVDRNLQTVSTQCDHDWQYNGTDYHGSHKGEDSYICTKCTAQEYRL